MSKFEVFEWSSSLKIFLDEYWALGTSRGFDIGAEDLATESL